MAKRDGLAVGVDRQVGYLGAQPGDHLIEDRDAADFEQPLVAAAHAPGEPAREDDAGDAFVRHHSPSPYPLPVGAVGERVDLLTLAPRMRGEGGTHRAAMGG